jgi:hypothetical protein
LILDVLALQYLYGKNTSINSGDTLFNITTTNFYATLWDPSGSDTVSAAGSNKGWTISLPSQILSKLVDTKTGIAIPTSELSLVSPLTLYWLAGDIENAQGGSSNDTLTGNELNNKLTGGPGNDILDGLTGVDTATYSGKRSNYTLTKSASTYTVIDKTNADGIDTLTNIENLTFSDFTTPTSIDLFLATKGTAVAARGAVDSASAIATQMSVVYLGRPADKTLLLDLKTALGNGQPSAALLNLIAAKAIQDGAFASSNSSKDVIVNTFKNIMGFLPSAYEQTEWAKYIDNGTLTKANAPWIIFQSYLGANNVPDVYKLPTQARFVAAQTFSDYAFLDTHQAGLASLNSIYANAARKWLAPVDSVSHAASKMQTMIADIESVTLTGVAPVDSFVG